MADRTEKTTQTGRFPHWYEAESNEIYANPITYFEHELEAAEKAGEGWGDDQGEIRAMYEAGRAVIEQIATGLKNNDPAARQKAINYLKIDQAKWLESAASAEGKDAVALGRNPERQFLREEFLGAAQTASTIGEDQAARLGSLIKMLQPQN
ncbi:MAG: hypothetical protein UY21_C0006G0014 [Microgenomates group bacterium GW2011_GWA1_48_10]|uniref:Uncharacterized protein n=1 Tax=Candidatus Gottesmanbacteria bacterium RIFCSPHIGHO2_01_FULL_47_48 TaxID=1798381 RepID=A0A1F6A3V7_9BACT|nr:MAG: hypothetical protein UY21_C0006G0014 [Microgenomates group bacterium GW2011_GWA1_48_10]OGG19400.1 MAG: hypothetical protein A2721_02640 [Candidatus Gottesmanbacteria bacterium RIFCSPHIGHO2_01_FULL_47_48]